MKPRELLFIPFSLLVLNALLLYYVEKINNNQTRQIEDLIFDLVVNDTNKIDIHIVDWHLFTTAVMKVESGHNQTAIGKTNDVGVLQITPIYVKEVNRILGQNKYSLEDRFDKYKSIEMFEVMNGKYNPEKSFYKAMRLHNPNAPESYRKAILAEYYKLKSNDIN